MRTQNTWLPSLCTVLLGSSMQAEEDRGWAHWGGDEKSQRYGPYDQIDANNFGG